MCNTLLYFLSSSSHTRSKTAQQNVIHLLFHYSLLIIHCFFMSTYCIGDIHGCFVELQALLELIKFNSSTDQLYFVGDLVNRGPDSLKVLRFIKQLPNTTVILGNHDLHLLGLFYQVVTFEAADLNPILAAPDCPELIVWLKTRRLLVYEQKFNAVIVHAGIPPSWDLQQALTLATEAETILQSDARDFLQHMYGDEPNEWHNNLQGYDRFRFIINALARMRFSSLTGKLDFTCKEKIGPTNYLPWFQVPQRRIKNVDIIFGHWSATEGKCDTPHVYALDTGCVWGGSLTALRLEDKKLFKIKKADNMSALLK